MDAPNSWVHKKPWNANEWLKLDLQQRKNITGISVGTCKTDANRYVTNFALEFGN